MSERLSPSPESHRSPEKHAEAEHTPEKQAHAKKEHEPKSHEKKTDLESIKKSIESSAVSGKEYSVGEKGSTNESDSPTNTKELKKSAYRKVIKQAQAHLNKTEKSFSKFIHKPTVEKVSDVSAKTIARPTGLLFGSIFAFLASSAFYYISKRSGFEYNYFVFIAVFIGGYFFGLLVEMFSWLLKKPSKRHR